MLRLPFGLALRRRPCSERNTLAFRSRVTFVVGQQSVIHATRPSFAGRHWSAEEDDILVKFYKLRDAGDTAEAAPAKLCGRTFSAVGERLLRLRKRNPELSAPIRSRRLFTKREDDQILSMRAAGASWQTISVSMPNRSLKSLTTRYYSAHGNKSGSSSPRMCSASTSPCSRAWTTEELEELRRLREVLQLSWQQVSAKMSRTIHSVTNKYYKLKARTQLSWTAEEDAKLVAEDGSKAWEEVAMQLPGRSVGAVKARRWYLKETCCPPSQQARHLWTAEEHAILHRLRVDGADYETICAALPGRTISAIISKTYRELNRTKL